jgi:mannose-6-phosphate isomerase-like protein (cupin superfamily)
MSEEKYLEVGHRPWGSYYVLIDEPNYKVKKLVVKPDQRLSLQSHEHRAEHWVVVEGTGTMEVRVGSEDNWVKDYVIGEYIYVPLRAIHRIRNNGKHELVIIEVQNGDYTGEDDITRYEDDYGRVGG